MEDDHLLFSLHGVYNVGTTHLKVGSAITTSKVRVCVYIYVRLRRGIYDAHLGGLLAGAARSLLGGSARY